MTFSLGMIRLPTMSAVRSLISLISSESVGIGAICITFSPLIYELMYETNAMLASF